MSARTSRMHPRERTEPGRVVPAPQTLNPERADHDAPSQVRCRARGPDLRAQGSGPAVRPVRWTKAVDPRPSCASCGTPRCNLPGRVATACVPGQRLDRRGAGIPAPCENRRRNQGQMWGREPVSGRRSRTCGSLLRRLPPASTAASNRVSNRASTPASAVPPCALRALFRALRSLPFGIAPRASGRGPVALQGLGGFQSRRDPRHCRPISEASPSSGGASISRASAPCFRA